MGTEINKSSLGNLGDKSDAQKLEGAVNKADDTLSSVEKIAGKVENIIGMITKLKKTGNKEKETSLSTSVAPKIEKNVNQEVAQIKINLKNSAKVKVDIVNLEEQLNSFLDDVDEKKTIADLKKDLAKLKKLGMFEKVINDFILKNCEVTFE